MEYIVDEYWKMNALREKLSVYRKQLRQLNKAHRLLLLEHRELKSRYDGIHVSELVSVPEEQSAVPAPQSPWFEQSKRLMAHKISAQFVWHTTSQGHHYWYQVIEHLRRLPISCALNYEPTESSLVSHDIQNAFIWSKTSAGDAYWNDVVSNLEALGK